MASCRVGEPDATGSVNLWWTRRSTQSSRYECDVKCSAFVLVLETYKHRAANHRFARVSVAAIR